jgi:hypothetical protein
VIARYAVWFARWLAAVAVGTLAAGAFGQLVFGEARLWSWSTFGVMLVVLVGNSVYEQWNAHRERKA